jgi:hypothetical protein
VLTKINHQEEKEMQMVSHEQIIEACRPVLQEVGIHLPETINKRRFVTAYQIWFRLHERNDPICQMLIDACRGEFIGKDAGSNIGPAQKIAQALGRSCPDVETQYIDTRYLRIDGVEPSSAEDCGLFRLKQDESIV